MDANARVDSSRIAESRIAIAGNGWQEHRSGLAKVAGPRMDAFQRTGDTPGSLSNRKPSHASEGRRR